MKTLREWKALQERWDQNSSNVNATDTDKARSSPMFAPTLTDTLRLEWERAVTAKIDRVK